MLRSLQFQMEHYESRQLIHSKPLQCGEGKATVILSFSEESQRCFAKAQHDEGMCCRSAGGSPAESRLVSLSNQKLAFFCYKTDCHSGCDENTGKCAIECIKEQYKCNDSSIYECDDDGQWDITWWHCHYGCASEEVSTSFIGLCADE